MWTRRGTTELTANHQETITIRCRGEGSVPMVIRWWIAAGGGGVGGARSGVLVVVDGGA